MAVATPLAPPARTNDQRLEALQRANQIRVTRARVKKLIREGVLDIADVLTNPMPELHSMKVMELLRAAQKIGPVKTLRMMNVCRISHGKTIGGLSARQRGELIRVFTVGIRAY